MEKVHVELAPAGEDEGWRVMKTIPLDSLPYSQVGSTYLLLAMPEEGNLTGTFSAVLKFQVRDVDPTTGEPESDDFYDDTYAVSFLFYLVTLLFSVGKSGNFARRLHPSHP